MMHQRRIAPPKIVLVRNSDQAQYSCFGDMHPSKRVGQALLLTVLLMGTAILIATTIAGLLMVYQIRGSTDIASSQLALSAADAGLECQMYDEFLQNDSSGNPDPSFVYHICGGDTSDLSFMNGAEVANVTCTDALDAATDCVQTSTVSNIYSRGNYNGVSRALQISF